MMISLFRRMEGWLSNWAVFRDRDGAIVLSAGVYTAADAEWESEELELGAAGYHETDNRVSTEVERLITEGYHVLYGYLPSGVLPQTAERLGREPGIEVEPNRDELIPIRRPGAPMGTRGRDYLRLPTALSSAAK